MEIEKASFARPLLSICIPTYNRSKLLARTLRSFENGTPEVEVIVCDNSHNRDSEKITNEILTSFQGPWSYHKNEPPVGPIDNVNKAIKLSKGRLVYVLHDDDYLFPGGLAKILATLHQHPCQPVFSFGVKVVDIHERTIQVEAPKRETHLSMKDALLKALGNSSYIRMPSIIISREAYHKVGFWDPGTAPPDDIDMFARLFSEFSLLKVPEIVAAYTVHQGAWTEKVFNPETIKILMKIYDKVDGKGVLSHKELHVAKEYFFHQFILGGTYRSIKRGDFKKAKKVMKLFDMDQVKVLKAPLKWLPVKLAFRTILVPF